MTTNARKTALDWLLNRPILTNLLILGMAFIVLGLYARYEATADPAISFVGLTITGPFLHATAILCREVGFALLVAVTLNFSIEAFNRRRHAREKELLLTTLDEAHGAQQQRLIDSLDSRHKTHLENVNSKIFQVLYQRNVPEVIFREVENQLLRCQFVREKSQYSYLIERIDPAYVSMNVSHRYTVENISSGTAEYELQIGFDVIKVLASKYTIKRIRAGGKEIHDIKPEVSSKSETHEWWQVRLNVPIKSGELVHCEIEYARVSPANGKEVICTLMPSKELILEVTDPKHEFSFRAMALYPRPEIDHAPGNNPFLHRWSIDGSLFPGQGFLFDWMPKQSMNESSDADVVVKKLLTTAENSPTLEATGEEPMRDIVKN
jgi:hypothetical protein